MKNLDKAKKRGATRKDLVKGRKFQRDSRRAQREGDKLKKDVLRIGKAMVKLMIAEKLKNKKKKTYMISITRRKKEKTLAPMKKDLKRKTF